MKLGKTARATSRPATNRTSAASRSRSIAAGRRSRRTLGKRKFRFVNTHLEAFGDTKIREAQAKELMAGPLKTKTQVVLVGDLNSGIARHNQPEKPGDDLAFKALKGFKDNGARQSCCFSSLTDPRAISITPSTTCSPSRA